MRKTYFVFSLIFSLFLVFCTPVLAATEYGVIYEETDELGSDTLTIQGEQTLPQLSEMLGLDLRVDVLTQISYGSITDTAAGIYDKYDYGYGEEKEGVTLTIFMELQDAGYYAMPSEGWCIYANISESRGSSQELANVVRDAVEPSMAEQAWNGEDITMSAAALTQAVDSMAKAAEDYILTNCPPARSEPKTPGTSQAPEQNNGVEVEYIFDISEVLSYEQWDELESRAADISKRQHCGVYFALVNDYTEYGNGDVYNVTYQLYHSSQFGMGEGRDGIIVLLSMEERDYAMFVYGQYAEYAFNEFGQEKLEERFLKDFGYDDWYGGISNYLDTCDEFLTKAHEGDPVRPPYGIYFLIMTGLGCLAATIVCFRLMRGMKTVEVSAEADVYVTKDGLKLTKQSDQLCHTTVTRTKIQKSSGGSSTYSGSTHRESGGGGSGRSGKF